MTFAFRPKMSYICLSRGEDTEKSRQMAAFFIAKREKKVRCFLKKVGTFSEKVRSCEKKVRSRSISF